MTLLRKITDKVDISFLTWHSGNQLASKQRRLLYKHNGSTKYKTYVHVEISDSFRNVGHGVMFTVSTPMMYTWYITQVNHVILSLRFATCTSLRNMFQIRIY
jgi:hypothetical protein